jgi:hypothetical protein
MNARQRIQWAAGLAIAIVVPGMGTAQAQQAPGISTVPDIRAPQSLGFNPGVFRPFSPDIRAPQSLGFNPGIVSPFTPDIRQPLTGAFSPAVNVPITAPFVLGDTVTGATGGALFFVGPSGTFWLPQQGVAVQPVPVPVAVPMPVTPEQQQALAAQAAQRPRLRLTPTPERRSIQAAEQVMARTPLTEGIVVSANERNVQVRVGTVVRSYSRSQVFFFTNDGEMRSADVQRTGLVRGLRVLVPATNANA